MSFRVHLALVCALLSCAAVVFACGSEVDTSESESTETETDAVETPPTGTPPGWVDKSRPCDASAKSSANGGGTSAVD